MINFNPEPVVSTPVLTPQVAQEIYALIKLHGNVDSAYKLKGNSDFEPSHFAQVQDELNRLGGQILQMKAGSYIIEPGYPARHNEEGEVEEEAVAPVYLDPEKKALFKNYLTSELLDIDTLLTDLA